MSIRKTNTRSGFTIVELLIVIVVIGILAAITIVAYNGVQGRANNSVVQGDLRNTFNKLEQYYAINGNYPASTDTATLNTLIIATRRSYGGGNNTYLYCRSNTDVAVVGRSTSGQGYAYSSKGGLLTIDPWPGDGNANLCPVAGLPTTTPGYGFAWVYANGIWQSWYTAGA